MRSLLCLFIFAAFVAFALAEPVARPEADPFFFGLGGEGRGGWGRGYGGGGWGGGGWGGGYGREGGGWGGGWGRR